MGEPSSAITSAAATRLGAALGGDVPAEVLDRVDAHTVVDHRLEERVLRHLACDPHRDRSTADDVALLAVVGVAPPERVEIAHDHDVDVTPLRLRRRRTPLDHLGERIRRVCIEPFGRTAALLRGAPQPLRVTLEPVRERHPDVGREPECAGDHAQVVAPVPH